MKKTVYFVASLVFALFCQPTVAQDGLSENFEGFEIGGIHEQFGWTTNPESNYNDSFIVDSGVAEFGDRSLLHTIPNEPPILFEVRSPPFSTSPGVGLFFDVLIENTEHEYKFKPYDLGGGIQNTILLLETDGRIKALQLRNCGCFTSVYHLTSGHWEANQITRFGFVVTEDGNLNIYQDGQLIFAGHDMATSYPFGGVDSGIGQLRIEKGLSFNADSSSILIDNISNSMSRFQLGDVNRDGEINLLDVQPFVDLLATGEFQAEADMNGDGLVNLLDVAEFVANLSA